MLHSLTGTGFPVMSEYIATCLIVSDIPVLWGISDIPVIWGVSDIP